MATRLCMNTCRSIKSLFHLLKFAVCTALLLLTEESGLLSLCYASRLAIKRCEPYRRSAHESKSGHKFPAAMKSDTYLKMNQQDFENHSKNSKQINFLLTKAVDIINKMTSKKKPKDYVEGGSATEVIATKESIVRVPVKFSFSSTRKHSISLLDPLAAVEYLSLPVEAYSVLDSNLVGRSLVADDTFILSLPLGDLASASQVVSGYASGVKLAATLRTEVTVRPDPQNGRVVMESGPIYFTPTQPKARILNADRATLSQSEKPDVVDRADDSTSDGISDEVDVEVPTGFSDALPEWLLWGGRTSKTSNTVVNNNDAIDYDNDEYLKGTSKSDNRDNKNDGNEDVVKSSVQARFRIELQWKTVNIPDTGNQKGLNGFMSRANSMRKNFFGKENILDEVDTDIEHIGVINDLSFASNNSDSGSDNVVSGSDSPLNNSNDVNEVTDSNESSQSLPNAIIDENVISEEEIESLPVTAVVKVWVDVNLPVRSDLSSALSFPPVKLLLSKAGALTTKAVLGTLAPVLGTLLVRDHDSRRNKINNVDVIKKNSVESIKYERTENIYDNLTADIEIK